MLNIWSIIIGLFMVAVGLAGVVAPTDIGTIAQNATTPAAVWVLAAFVIVLGTLLIRASRTARIPIVIKAVGAIAILGGLAMPFAGPQIVNWWVDQGPTVIRAASIIKIAVGAAVVVAANP